MAVTTTVVVPLQEAVKSLRYLKKEHLKIFNNRFLSKVTSNQSSCYLPLCFLYSLIVVFENEVGKGSVYMDHLVVFVLLLNSGRLNYCWPSTEKILTCHLFFRL